jgi:MFS family permease
MTQITNPRKTIGILAFTQVMSWGSLYYAIAILAPEIQKEMGWRAEIVFGAFSWSLLIAGFASTPIGILLDRFGGRVVMGVGSFVCGSGLMMLGLNHSIVIYFIAWTLLGLGMALSLYEAAFATINREFVSNSRQAISTLTLFGGFASTLFWPLTLQLNTMIGWRNTYLLYGAVQLALCMPLHLMLNTHRQKTVEATNAKTDSALARSHTLNEALHNPAFWKLALAFSANSFVFTALSVHLIPLLKQMGHAATLAVIMVALIGPMQVAGRLGEMMIARRALPQTVGKFTFSTLPGALLILILFGSQQWAVALYCILYGLSNGIVTIVRGTLPQTLFGRENYGAISGALAAPSLIAKAAGPLIMAVVIQHTTTPLPSLLIFLAFAMISLSFYLAAIKVDQSVMKSAVEVALKLKQN